MDSSLKSPDRLSNVLSSEALFISRVIGILRGVKDICGQLCRVEYINGQRIGNTAFHMKQTT